MNYGFKVTTHGRAVLAACAALSVPPRFTRAAVGSGRVDGGVNLADVHQLIRYEDEGAVGERSHEGDRLYLTVQYSNKERTAGAFTLNEFMLFAEDPATGLETDFLYATLGDYPQGIPGHDEMLPSGVWNFPLMILISDELEVEISASPGLVTWGDMETLIAQMATEKKVSEAVARHSADTAAHPNLLGLCMGLDSRVTLMELMFRTQVKGNPFTVTFESLEGLDVAGVWNAAQGRVEF